MGCRDAPKSRNVPCPYMANHFHIPPPEIPILLTIAEKDIIVALFTNAASLGHARWPYWRKERTLPVPNYDTNWMADSGKASTKSIIDRFSALSTRIDMNTEISRIISSIDKKAPLILIKLPMLNMERIVLKALSLYFSYKKSFQNKT